MSENTKNSINRRSFSLGTAALALGAANVHAADTPAPKKVKLGVIGCGGRGSWIAGLFAAHGGYEVVAGADYFQDRLDAFGKKFSIVGDKLYAGLGGYKKLLESGGVDAVAIESPPYFHPEQAEAAVAAGKHAYVAKPVAVDVPGCKSIEASGAAATKKGLVYLVDFQTRADQYYMECLKRVHDGGLGTLCFGEATYHASDPFMRMTLELQKDPKNPELKLRAWGVDQALSGDIITEQNIHTLDVASWIMNQDPVRAFGTGARKIRKLGNCYDTFTITFEYPDQVGVAFSSKQFSGHGTQPAGIRNRMFGSEGVLETSYGGDCLVRGKSFYRGGKSPSIYKSGAVKNIADFHAAIQSGDCKNETVAPSVQSNLVTVLGRTAAYEGRIVEWQEMLEANETLAADLSGLKA